MKLVKPTYEIISEINANYILSLIEDAGRTCYKSEDRKTTDSAKLFVKMILGKNHESVIEHFAVTVRFIIDRGVSHELVRHRLASFSQESTRYCNYSKDKFDNQITFIIPPWVSDEELKLLKSDNELDIVGVSESSLLWYKSLIQCEASYQSLINCGWSPQQARSVLPNALKTEIVVTANLREWRTIFKQRTSQAAHPQMREIMVPLLKEMQNKIPIIFDDL